MTNNFAFEVKVDLCLKYTFTGGGWGVGGWLDKLIIMLISAPVGFELGLGAELGKSHENESSMLIEAAEASVANEVMYTEAVKPKIEKQNIEVNANAVLDYDLGPRG